MKLYTPRSKTEPQKERAVEADSSQEACKLVDSQVGEETLLKEEMICSCCNKRKPISQGKLSLDKKTMLCWECDKLLGKGPGYK